MNKVLIVIPAYNEEANIENVVRELEDKYPQFVILWSMTAPETGQQPFAGKTVSTCWIFR